MKSFSTIACYAALKSCSKDDILLAYARMLAALIQRRRYKTINVETLCRDFETYYGFGIPYHPMLTIERECIKYGFLTYNNSVHQYVPNYECIDKEDFMKIVEQKSIEHQGIVRLFQKHLSDTYNLFVSEEEANEQMLAFIERYGIRTKSDKSLLKKVRDDFLFADFLVNCEESGNYDVMNYLDEYTVGLSLSEIFTYCERPETYIAKGTSVYLDTGILFRLLGICSYDSAGSYNSLIKNMHQLGIRTMAYEHTINEMIGIIEAAKYWIGNSDFDATLASEATCYFIRENWTASEVDELSCNLRIKLNEDFNITIDNMEYPKVENIRTPSEATIKDMIIEEYKENHSAERINEIDHSIDQDARSIFFTQHKNGDIIPYHINDVKNIFITTNRALARVGYKLSSSIANSRSHFIPTVLTDVQFGTLLWFNSPAQISAINRPRLVSAAYAAFRPSNAITQKLNNSLKTLEENGKILPEQCYLLKVDPVAQRLLAKMTVNDPDNFMEDTPLEILKELRRKAYEEGTNSRQNEIDILTEEKERAKFELAIEQQKRVIADCENALKNIELKIENTKEKKEQLLDRLAEYCATKKEIDVKVKNRMTLIKWSFSIVAVSLVAFSIWIGYKCSWIPGVVTMIAPLCIFIITMWGREDVTVLSLIPKIEKRISNRQCKKYLYSEEKVESTQELYEQTCAELNDAIKDRASIAETLKKEKMKMDEFSIDISLVKERGIKMSN